MVRTRVTAVEAVRHGVRDENIFCRLKKKGVKADSEVSGLGERKDDDGIN